MLLPHILGVHEECKGIEDAVPMDVDARLDRIRTGPEDAIQQASSPVHS